MNRFVTRAYNNFEKISDSLVLKSSRENHDKIIEEFCYIVTVDNDVKSFFPIVHSCTIGDKTGYAMDFYDFSNAYDISRNDNKHQVLESVVKSWMKVCSVSKQIGGTFSVVQMYYDRVLKEVDNLWLNFDAEIFKQSQININGKIGLITDTQELLTHFRYMLSDVSWTFIHGDLTLSNVLVSDDLSIVKFIDPRGSFAGVRGHYGDGLYDIAKLYHSYVEKYEDFINGNFTVNIENDNFEYWPRRSVDDEIEFFEIVEKYFGVCDRKLIKGMVGSIFLAMCARHYENKDRQCIFYAKGLELLNECHANSFTS